MASKTRLYVEHPLGQGQSVPLSRDQAHYLFSVMRMPVGTILSLLNSADGEWDAEVVEAGKKGGLLLCQAQTRPMTMPPDLWLMFAPVRKERTSFIVEKAVEMGARKLLPVQTDFTNKADRLRIDKIRAQVVEAAEQCGATYVPDVSEIAKLSGVLDGWDTRQIMFADEMMIGQAPTLPGEASAPWAILIGPEGGFSPRERDRLRGMEMAHPVSLGPRILRAETAVVAAMTLWQTTNGDWK
jgi:16S rRNA (uracil1498-N3)-methyltransferase